MRWQQYRVNTTLPLHRQGWLGVYDAIKAAVARTPRLTVETPVTLSFWAKGAVPAVAINGVSLEAQPMHDNLAACQRHYEKLSPASQPAP